MDQRSAGALRFSGNAGALRFLQRNCSHHDEITAILMRTTAPSLINFFDWELREQPDFVFCRSSHLAIVENSSRVDARVLPLDSSVLRESKPVE